MAEELEKKDAEPKAEGAMTDEDVETVAGGAFAIPETKLPPVQIIRTVDGHQKR